MQVYKTFWKLALHWFPSTILYFVIFMIIAFFLSNTNDTANKFKVSSVDLCIIDEDDSAASRALTDYLCSIHHRVHIDAKDTESLQDNLFYQQIGYVLTIPAGFEKDLTTEGDCKLTTSKRKDSANGYFLDHQINAYVNELSMLLVSGVSVEEASKELNQTLKNIPEVSSLTFEKKTDNCSDQLYYFFQYLPYVFIMMLLQGLAPILGSFRRPELAARIQCASMPRSLHNGYVAISCACYSVIMWLIYMILGLIIYTPEQFFSTNGLLCILNSFVFLLISVSITLLIGSFSLKNEALQMISNILALGMCFLCGIFVPQYLLSDTVLSFARFLPAYWYVRIINMLGGLSDELMSMKTYWHCMGIQMLFVVAIFALYLGLNPRSKRR